METTQELSGLEKASVLLLSLGSRTTEEVLSCLSRQERDILDAQILRMRHVKSLVRQQVLDEVADIVRTGKLEEPVEPVQSEPTGPLSWLEKLDPEDIAEAITHERPSNIALVVAHLSPNTAARVLFHLDEKVRNSVAYRLTNLNNVSEAAVSAIDELLRKRLLDNPKVGNGKHVRPAVFRVIEDATNKAKESVLSALSRGESEQSPIIVEFFTSPEDLAGLSNDDIQAVLMEVDMDDLCLCLRVASENLTSAVLRNVPSGIAEIIRQNVAAPNQLRLSDIEAAQDRLVGIMRRLSRECAFHGGTAVGEVAVA